MATRMAQRIVATLLLLALAFTVMSQERREVPAFRAYGEPASAPDATAVQRLIEQYKDAWARQDTNAFIGLHSEDTEWINSHCAHGCALANPPYCAFV